MTKLREAGSCAEAQWEFAKTIGRQSVGETASDEAARAEGIAQMARVLGISKGVVRNMLDPDMPEKLSLERAGLLARAFGVDLLARWLSAEAGGVFIPLPDPSDDMQRLGAKGIVAVGAAMSRIMEAQAAHSEAGTEISLREAREISGDVRKVVEAFSLIARLMGDVMRKVARPAKR